MFCQYCGKQVPDTARFCPYCGKEIKNVQSINKEKLNIKTEKKATSSKGRKVFIILIVLLLIAGSGIFLYNKSIEKNSKEAYDSAIVAIDKGEFERAIKVLKPYYKDSDECAILYFYANAKDAEKTNQVELFEISTEGLKIDKEKGGKYTADIDRILNNKEQIIQKMRLQRGF